jgi:uncharacterized protein with PCYCGC motif
MKIRKLAIPAACALYAVGAFAQWTPPYGTPSYHQSPPAKHQHLAPLLSPAKLDPKDPKYKYQRIAYLMAARIQNIIYQLPCYCYCDRRDKHSSLRSCFESGHAAHCSECMKSAVYAYQQTKAGKSVQEIRDGLARGEFIHVDLNSAAI